MSKSKELREERARIIIAAQALLNTTPLTPEIRTKFNEEMAKADALKTDIDLIERADAAVAELAGSRQLPNPPVGNPGTVEERVAAHKAAHRSATLDYWRNGVKNMSEANRAFFAAVYERRDTDAQGQAAGSQSISYTAGAAGGYFVPAGYVYDVDVATKYFAPLMDGAVCRLLETATGNVLPYPTNNDTANVSAILSENTQETENPLTMGVVNFGAFKYSSRIVRISLELLQDSAFDLEAFLKQQFAIRFGRGYEAAFTTGAGGGAAPTGIVTAVLNSGAAQVVAEGANPNSGNVGDTGVNSIGTPDLVNLEHAVDPTYRRGAKFMLHDDTLRQIKNLLDKFGRPIWLPGLAVNAPDTILGYPYVINQSMAKIAASAHTVLFGDMQKFIIRKVRELAVLRLDERYADFGQVGFIGFSRVDSNLVDAGTHPIKILTQAS